MEHSNTPYESVSVTKSMNSILLLIIDNIRL